MPQQKAPHAKKVLASHFLGETRPGPETITPHDTNLIRGDGSWLSAASLHSAVSPPKAVRISVGSLTRLKIKLQNASTRQRRRILSAVTRDFSARNSSLRAPRATIAARPIQLLCPRVRIEVVLTQRIGRHLCVNLSGGDRCVPQHFLHRAHIGTPGKQMGGKGVAKRVR